MSAPRLRPLRGATLENTHAETCRIHGDATADLLSQQWRIDARPPLTVTRLALPSGAHKPPVLLVHGFAQNRYTWHTRHRSPAAGLARAGFDVFNLELRGHGLSRFEGEAGAEAFADYVEDVRRTVEALPGRAFLIGHSLGGAAIYGAATELATGPWEPRGVVGIGAVYGFGQGNPLLKAAGLATHAMSSRIPGLSRVQVRSRWIGRALGQMYGMTDILGYTVPVSGWWPGSIEPELLAERLEEGFDWTSVQVWQDMSRWAAAGVFDYDAAWRTTDVPLLVVLGDKDHLLPHEAGRLAYDRSGSRDRSLQLMTDWDHEVHWGHLDLVLGRLAPRHVWPLIHDWMVARCP